MEKIVPAYIKEGEDFCDITLAKPITVGGAKVSVLRMREPSVDDQLVAQAPGGSDAEVEVRLMGNLCQLAPEEIRGMKIRNYRRVQAGYGLFTD